jgi:hypothetical protein
MMAYEKICQQTNTYIKSLDLNTDNETLVGYKAPNTLQQMLFFQNPNFITLYDPDFSACTFNVMFFEELVLKLNLPPGLNYQLRRGANNKIIKLYLCDYRAMQAYQHWRAQCSKSVQMGRCGDQASIAWQYIAKKYPAIKVSICEYNFYNHTFLKLEDPQGQLLYYCPWSEKFNCSMSSLFAELKRGFPFYFNLAINTETPEKQSVYRAYPQSYRLTLPACHTDYGKMEYQMTNGKTSILSKQTAAIARQPRRTSSAPGLRRPPPPRTKTCGCCSCLDCLYRLFFGKQKTK